MSGRGTKLSPRALTRLRPHGLDRRDEVWDGELHVVPPPHSDHGRIELKLGAFFEYQWEQRGLGRAFLETGVKRPGAGPIRILGEEVPEDYRTPDLCFLLPERFARSVGGWIVGGPDVVLEVESPGDESRLKLPFYLAVGVREVIFIDRSTRRVELLRATGTAWSAVAPSPDGWVRSELLRVELRTEPGALRIRRSDEPSRELVIGQ